jgi:hypothetical protein
VRDREVDGLRTFKRNNHQKKKQNIFFEKEARWKELLPDNVDVIDEVTLGSVTFRNTPKRKCLNLLALAAKEHFGFPRLKAARITKLAVRDRWI